MGALAGIEGGKALVLASGGLDSSTLLAAFVDRLGADNVAALSIRYGQRHLREIDSAKRIAEHYGVEQHFLDLGACFAGGSSSLLEESGEKIPHSTYADQRRHSPDETVSTYVPFRNGLFLSASAAQALTFGCDILAYGAHSDDFADQAYPDCSPRFVELMGGAISEGTAGKLSLVAPFIGWSKADIVALGAKLGVPFELTWSCYEGADKPCGQCATCLDRARAFGLCGIPDPLCC